MGLDMYLTGDKYLIAHWDDPQKILIEDGFRLKSRRLDLGYWRKHPDLHGYIVENFAGGVDDCREIDLSKEQMRQIIKAIHSDLLSKTTGFFFGESVNDAEEKNHAIEIFHKAIQWLEEEPSGEWRTVYYQASW